MTRGTGAVIRWMAAEAERPAEPEFRGPLGRKPPRRAGSLQQETAEIRMLIAHQFPARAEEVGRPDEDQNPHVSQKTREMGHAVQEVGRAVEQMPQPAESTAGDDLARAENECDPALRVYRGRTIGMLRRYMRYSIETGRLPSLLGREFFRAKVTSYTVVTFEDRVIFVHDMERCLGKMDEFSRQLLGRHILQEHDQEATARLMQCTERTVRTYVPIVLDRLSGILLEMGMLDQLDSNRKKSCQGGLESEIPASDCEESENKV
jgi:hypothetical protein